MATNLTSFVSEVIPEMPDCPEPTILNHVRKAIIEFCRRTEILTVSWNVDVNSNEPASSNNYQLNINTSGKMPDRKAIKVLKYIESGTEYDLIQHEKKNAVENFDGIFRNGTSRYYWINGDTITVYPVNISADIDVFIQAAFIPTNSITTIDDFIYNQHIETIVEGAKKRLFRIGKTEWYDPQQASLSHRIFEEGVSSAFINRRLEENKGKSNGRSRGFI